MERIWFRSHKPRNLSMHVNRIIRKWQLALKEYQNKTWELGYDNTEKANFGFFLWGCAQLKMPFLLEFTMDRKYRGEERGQGRPDGWILMDDNTTAIFEVKRIYDRLDTPPRNQIVKKIDLLGKELKSLKLWNRKVKRIGLCFVILERIKGKGTKELDKPLSKYLSNLKTRPFFDFFGVYQSTEEIVTKPYNIIKDKRNREFIYPVVIVIGKYV